MSDPHPPSSPKSQQASDSGRKQTVWQSKSILGTISAIVLVGGYTLVAPKIRETTGLALPTLTAGADGAVKVVQEPNQQDASGKSVESSKTFPTKTPAKANTSAQTKSNTETNKTAKPTTKSVQTPASSPAATMSKGPLADRMKSADATKSTQSDSKPATKNNSPAKPAVTPRPQDRGNAGDASDPDLLHGRLREVSPDRYMSLSGLLYTPGSAEGHRLEHVRRHTQDQPSRPGNHGVFDGGMDGAIKTIDMAYEQALKKMKTTVTKEEGRTVYTVDMGGRIGYVGGREGNKKNKPMARRVRLVLEGNRVITAFPL
jgi:hypothetical protein